MVEDADFAAGPDARAPVAVERRRPGRGNDVSPELVGLLRGEVSVPDEALPTAGAAPVEGTDLSVAFGIAHSVGLSVPFWSVACLVAWLAS